VFSSGSFAASCGRGTLWESATTSQALKSIVGAAGVMPLVVIGRPARVVGSTCMEMTSGRFADWLGAVGWARDGCDAGAQPATAMVVTSRKAHEVFLNILASDQVINHSGLHSSAPRSTAQTVRWRSWL
jgi:hypothetical protein